MIFSKVYLFPCFALCSAQDIDNFHDVQNVLLSGLDLNFQGHLSPWTSEIENLPLLHEMTPVLAIIYVIIFLIIDLSCWTSVIIIQPVQGAIFQNFYLSGTVGQSLRSSPACADLFSRPLYRSIYRLIMWFLCGFECIPKITTVYISQQWLEFVFAVREMSGKFLLPTPWQPWS